ncbi:hypothetical protein D3C73_1421750 [compost metagenome]
MIAVGNGHKINIHQPFTASGDILTPGQNHHVRIGMCRQPIVSILQHFSQTHLRLRPRLLELLEDREQAFAWEDAIYHQIQSCSRAIA